MSPPSWWRPEFQQLDNEYMVGISGQSPDLESQGPDAFDKESIRPR
jgi:hypothetical protein